MQSFHNAVSLLLISLKMACINMYSILLYLVKNMKIKNKMFRNILKIYILMCFWGTCYNMYRNTKIENMYDFKRRRRVINKVEFSNFLHMDKID